MIEYDGTEYRIWDAHTHWTNLISSILKPFFAKGLVMPEFFPLLQQEVKNLHRKSQNAPKTRLERNIMLYPALLDHFGIDKAVVLPIFQFDVPFSNAMEQLFPDRVIGFGFINPRHPKVEEHYERLRKLPLKPKGIKLHADFSKFSPKLHFPELIRTFEFLDRERMTALFHTGSHFDIKDLDPFLKQFPRVPVILGHSGLSPQIDQALAIARVHPQVYLEISGQPYSYMIEKAIKTPEIGVDRILYGSDLPSLHPIVEMMKILSLPVSESEKELILCKNLENLIKT
jgi:predicted TIM-barrel fold metal-dependent hydrolase